MPYICYVYTRGSSVPHMEAIDSPTLGEAKVQSSRMLGDHKRPLRAELFEGDQRVATISAEEARLARG